MVRQNFSSDINLWGHSDDVKGVTWFKSTIKETYFASSSFFLSFSVSYMLLCMQKIVKVKKVGKVPPTEITAPQNAYVSMSHFCTI